MNRLLLIAAAALSVSIATVASAQSRPSPRQADPRAARSQDRSAQSKDQRPAFPDAGGARFDDLEIVEDNGDRDALHRRVPPPEKVVLRFRDADIEQMIPWIAEMTGKTVIPVNLAVLRSTKITLVNDEFIDRMTALDLLFTTFRLNNIGIIEREDVIVVGQLDMIPQLGLFPVLTGRTDIMHRRDVGTMVIKIFPLYNANVEFVGDRVTELIPGYATLSVDPNSNQLVVIADIGVCQQIQKLVDELDKTFIEEETRTFRLAHADAVEVMEIILDLFPEQTDQTQRRRPAARTGRTPTRPQQQAGAASATSIGPQVQLRVAVVSNQNSITVTAKPAIVHQIADLIHNEWDRPRPFGTAKVYTLKYSDPVRMREMLRTVLGQGSGTTGIAAGRTGGATAQRTDVSSQVAGIYSIEAFPEHNQLVVLSKTEDTFSFLDHLVNELDQRTNAGLPIIMELKHADAVMLAEELNALLQETGGGANIPAPSRGLTMTGFSDSGASRTGGATGANGRGGGGGTAGRITFPWQTGSRDDRAPESALIGTSRIMPIVRQNALAIVAPAAHQTHLVEMVEMLDRPGRQVMITAVVAEVSLSDALALGLRVGSSDDILAARNPDYGIGGNVGVQAERDPLFTGNLFSSSILDVGFNVNVFLQALNRRNAVRVLQSPRIFTSDNQEAQFFDGQDVPFLAGTQFTDLGGIQETFDRQEVGVRLNVRPRITVHGDVDLELVLELSRVVPGTEGSRIIIDRRETTTQVVVKDGQTIVLSGILREEEFDVVRQIPLLGQLPIIGALFSSTDKETSQTELIAFITPIVVDNPSINDENFNVDERERLRQMSRPLDEHGREMDTIRDRISTPGSGASIAPLPEVIDPEVYDLDEPVEPDEPLDDDHLPEALPLPGESAQRNGIPNRAPERDDGAIFQPHDLID